MSLMFKEGLSFSGYERDGLYLNLEGHKFKDISGVSGIDSISDGRSPVIADFDNDGDYDVFLNTIQGEGHLLFRNNVGQDKEFIRVTLEGTDSGKDAFGAVIRLKTDQGLQTQVRSGGNGFMAYHDPRVLFGMGTGREADWIEVTWPSGRIDKLGPVKSGTSVRIVEGATDPGLLVEKKATLPDPVTRADAFWAQLKIRKGDPLPDFDLKVLESGVLKGQATLKKGKRYFLNFWATYCGPCRKEMPELQKLHPRFLEKGIELVGVSLDETPDGVQPFVDRLGVSYPLYLADPAKVGERLFSGDQFYIPLSMLVDGEGQVLDVYSGWSPETEERILELLK
jgi:peroxiredoxin